jgi:hypothetical protein
MFCFLKSKIKFLEDLMKQSIRFKNQFTLRSSLADLHLSLLKNYYHIYFDQIYILINSKYYL